MPPTKPLKIAIAGSGLAGLTAACRLAEDGHEVHLFERTEGLSIASGAIFVHSNAVRCIQRWRVSKAFEAVTSEIESSHIKNGLTNEKLMSSSGRMYSDVPDWSTDRQALQNVFYQLARKAGAKITFGNTLVDIIEHPTYVTVTCNNGTSLDADLFLAADGIGSRLRGKILTHYDAARISPIPVSATHYPTEIPMEALLANDLTASFVNTEDKHDAFVCTGQNGYVVIKYNQSRELCNAIWSIQHALGSDEDKNPRLFDETGNPKEVQEFFSSFHPQIQALANMTQSCSRWRLARLDPFETWSSPGRRLVLLGDSAHAMLPNLAQGYSSIVEDIDALSIILESGRDVKEAVELWEKFRLPRVAKLQEVSLQRFECFHRGEAPDTLLTEEERNLSMGDGDGEAPYHSPPFMKWVYDYDVAKEVKKMLG